MAKKGKGNTKGGKFVNPTDRARKEDRRKELKKNKKQRVAVRAAVIKGKDPQQILADMERLDQMEFNLEEPCPLNETVLANKRRKLMETWDRVVKLFLKEDKDKYTQIKRLESEYDRKRNELKKQFDAVKSAENVSLDDIPLPCLPEGPPASQGLKAPSLTVHRIETDREPPGHPPGPLPSLEEFDDREESSKKLKTGAESDVDAFLKEIEEVAVPVIPQSLPMLPLTAPPTILRPPIPATGAMIPPNIIDFRRNIMPPNFVPPGQSRPPFIQTRPTFDNNPGRSPSKAPKSRPIEGPSGATIEAKPQLRNLTLDSTRFVPTSLRLKRNEKQPTKPSSVSRPIGKFLSVSPVTNLTLVPSGSTAESSHATSSGNKEDAYEQFMKEIQGLI